MSFLAVTCSCTQECCKNKFKLPNFWNTHVIFIIPKCIFLKSQGEIIEDSYEVNNSTYEVSSKVCTKEIYIYNKEMSRYSGLSAWPWVQCSSPFVWWFKFDSRKRIQALKALPCLILSPERKNKMSILNKINKQKHEKECNRLFEIKLAIRCK